jgi:hypothetical protein
MTEEEYWASEMRDLNLDAAADAGEYFLEESGFNMMPTQAEMQQMAQEGEIILRWIGLTPFLLRLSCSTYAVIPRRRN